VAHARYPVSNLIPKSALPPLPSEPFPTARYEYLPGNLFVLHPLPPSSTSLPIHVTIENHIEVGFGLYRQQVACGTAALRNTEARIYDPLHVDVTDLPWIEGILHYSVTSLTLAVPEARPQSEHAVSHQNPSLEDGASTQAGSPKSPLSDDASTLSDDASTLSNLSQSLEAIQLPSLEAIQLPSNDPTLPWMSSSASYWQQPALQGLDTNTPSHNTHSSPLDQEKLIQNSLNSWSKWLAKRGSVSSLNSVISRLHLTS
jgi:hypothetical protein